MHAYRYEVVLDPNMEQWSKIGEHNGVGCVRLQEVRILTMADMADLYSNSNIIAMCCQLNINNIRIVSTVLGQSVALENYETQANAMMQVKSLIAAN